MFNDLEGSIFLPNALLTLLFFSVLWAGSITLGRFMSIYMLE